MSILFTPFRLGPYELPNRIVMAPMTRSRAGRARIPNTLMTRYYTQRASAGLLVTEGVQVSPQGIGYPATPGIHSPEQVAGWRYVTEAVHAVNGRIFLQLWHCGRVSHPLWQEGGALPVAPSAIAPRGQMYTSEGIKPYITPRALTIADIEDVIGQYRQGAQNALEAGFDGVEIHGANGYLPDQFLRDGTNQRTDQYGGAPEFRARFLLEVTRAAVDVWGPHQVGVRLSPSGTFNDMKDSNPAKTFGYAVTALDRLGIAYVHIIEGTDADLRHGGTLVPTELFRPLFKRALIVNGNYDRTRAEKILQGGIADLVSYGRLFLANPDLPKRLATGAPLNPPDPPTFYSGDEKGYIDYPSLEEASLAHP